jgi:hypothetical protein
MHKKAFKIFIVLITFCFIFNGCEKKQPEFYKLNLLFHSERHKIQDDYEYTSESYVIANPPSNEKDLQKAVADYCIKNISLPNKKEYLTNISFYQETWNTPRDYTEKEELIFSDFIGDHDDDLILELSYRKDEHWKQSVRYEFYKKSKMIKAITYLLDYNNIKIEEIEIPRPSTTKIEYIDGVKKKAVETISDYIKIDQSGNKSYSTKSSKGYF